MDYDRDLDRRVAGWISDGPNAAPREVVDRALVETTTVVQMPKHRDGNAVTSLIIGTLLALIVLAAAVGIAVLFLR